MTYKDLMKFCVQFAAMLLMFDVLIYLPYQFLMLFSGPDLYDVISFPTSLLLIYLVWSLWKNPYWLIPGTAESDRNKILENLNARMVVGSGSVILGLYFLGSGFDDFIQLCMVYVVEIVEPKLGDQSSDQYFVTEIVRGIFGLVLIIKAPHLGRWIGSRLETKVGAE